MALFPDVSSHPEYLTPQSKDWQQQLGNQTGKYEYTWNAYTIGDSEYTIFEKLLSSVINPTTTVLDVGCGHGEFTCSWASRVKKIIGIDMTAEFIETANHTRREIESVEFVDGNTKDGFPFPDDYFDVIYTRRGPTNWYPIANRVLKPGGNIFGLHPGDYSDVQEGLHTLFPGFFPRPPEGTPILDVLNERLARSNLKDIEIKSIQTQHIIPTVDDIMKMKLFGQSDNVRMFIWDQCYEKVKDMFNEHSTDEGILFSASHYIVTARGNA